MDSLFGGTMEGSPDSDLGLRRLPVFLLIDCSGSMAGSKIEAVNYGLKQLQTSMLSDPRMVEMAYISLISYGDSAFQQPLTPLTQFVPPTLTAHGVSAMGAALGLLAKSISYDVIDTGADRKGDYRPLAFLFTDGQPTDDIGAAMADLQALTRGKQPTIYAFGFGSDVNPETLLTLTDNVFLLQELTPQGIVACLGWVESCISKLLNSFSVPLSPSRPLQMPYPSGIPGLVRAGEESPPQAAGNTGPDVPASLRHLAGPRAKELADLSAANLAAGLAPYYSIQLQSPAELMWILHYHKWSGELYSVEEDADLRGVIANGLDLTNIRLARADLTGARLAGATLVAADFVDARLTGVDLVGADCTHVDFSNADLTGAKLERTKLREVKLEAANLDAARLIGTDASGADARMASFRGALLRNVDLSGANLREAIMDQTTRLIEPILNTRTCLGDMQLSDTPLTRVDWRQVPFLGDERLVNEAKRRQRGKSKGNATTSDASVAVAYRVVARAYRGLSIATRNQGLLVAASNFRLREQVLERKASFQEGRILAWIFSWILFIVAGYGERPARSFAAYLLVIVGFGVTYFGIGSGAMGLGTRDAISSPVAALVFSVTSFHGRGFFPGVLALDDPITVLAAIEAVLGLFIEITFIATFTQRFFAR
jgi:uncharacterized protein YegL/uncharacterized protein YjbI with pentapeptide repeats